SIELADGNALLRQQLGQSEQTNLALREDLQKLTADWTRAVEEAELREVNWQKEKECLMGHVTKEQGRLMCLWRSVISLKMDCLSLKTATDRVTELSLLVQSLESERKRWMEERREEERKVEEERSVEEEARRELERSYQCLSQAVVTLSMVLGSSPSPIDRLPSLLEVLSQAHSALQRRLQEQLEVGLVRRRWEELQESLQDRLHQLEADNMETHTLLQHTHLELAHTQQILARERETVLGLQVEVEVIEKREEEEKKEKRRIRREIEREEEERRRTEREGQKGVEETLMENAQLKEREIRSHMEIFILKGAVEKEQLDRRRAEEEAADAREALQKTRDSEVSLVSDLNLLKRQLAETRDSLDKMATLNQSLAKDKRELNTHILQMEAELADGHDQLRVLKSEVTSLQRNLRVLSQDYNQLK
ncbi:hypothetical protein CRUP_012964, partial [Coryphaenoides rupestris]